MEDTDPKIPVKSEIRPFKCPVCNGFGSLKFGKLICHSCEGKGYVLVPQKIEVDPNKL